MGKSQRDEATEFVNSWRGLWIISEALSVAVDTLEKIEPPSMRPVSDINDMKYLIKHLFGLYDATKQAQTLMDERTARIKTEE